MAFDELLPRGRDRLGDSGDARNLAENGYRVQNDELNAVAHMPEITELLAQMGDDNPWCHLGADGPRL